MSKESSIDISSTINNASHPRSQTVTLKRALPAALFIITGVLIGFSFVDGLENMVSNWGLEEYSHGYMIPLVSLLLLAKKIPALATIQAKHHWLGLVLLALGFALLLLGELSSLYTIIQYGFLVALTGLFICFLGANGTIMIFAPLAYLIFMVPLPEFIYFNLSSQLQLLSSSIGVFVIRLFDISVFLEGNVIDLGTYQLQVVEACSGLRYLFPLMSFGFLIAYLYQAPLWMRAIIFLSTIPITVLMNSFRIGVIGVTVNYWGIEAAEGFLHDFEGWAIFIACIGVLVLEITLLNTLIPESADSKINKNFSKRLDLDLPENINFSAIAAILPREIHYKTPALAALLITLMGLTSINLLGERTDNVPDRIQLNFLPLIKGDWIGRESALDIEVIDALDVSDYMIANYSHQDGGLPVNLYIAYYHSQRKGASIHSPKACIPGGGWEMSQFSTEYLAESNPLNGDSASASPLPQKVNRVVIQKGKSRSLVYYWFQQRGRTITSEYLAKWYLFWDGLTINRTDGALIRVVTPVPPGMDIQQADQHLISFLREFNPMLGDYIPN